MTPGSFSTSIIVAVCLSAVLCPSHGFELMQNITMRPDESAWISCEFTGDVDTVEDVRLNTIPLGQSQPRMLCQKGMKYCSNIIMREETPKKYIFVIFNIDAKAMNLMYQCEITVRVDDLDSTKHGSPTRLQAVTDELTASVSGLTEEKPTPVTTSLPPVSAVPSGWILIGLLALLALLVLLALYACIISFLYCRLKRSNKDPENSTYVEMRKALPNNPGLDIYCG